MRSVPPRVTAWALPSAKSGRAKAALISGSWVARSSVEIVWRTESYGPPSSIAPAIPVASRVTDGVEEAVQLAHGARVDRRAAGGHDRLRDQPSVVDPADGKPLGVSGSSRGTAARARPFRVVIAGGGVAAIEAALALGSLAGGRVDLTIAAGAPVFVYRPLAVLRPFQADSTYRLELEGIVADLGGTLVSQDAVAVDSEQRRLHLADGVGLDYDALLVAIGARAEPVLTGGTFTPWDWGEGHAFRSLLGSVGRGEIRRIAFVVPAGLTWPLPLYELALLTSAYVRRRSVGGASLQVITAERASLEVFGPEASRVVAGLLEQRGIALATGRETCSVDDGLVRTADGSSFAADATVALPLIEARPLPGLPTDGAGFLTVDGHCRVSGRTDVFAAGDCTNQPLKQGGLAAQQADVAAAGIAALAGADVAPAVFRPVLEAVLLTGDTPLHLDGSGARPIESNDADIADRERREKIFARHLTPYLAGTTPALPYLDRPVEGRPPSDQAPR